MEFKPATDELMRLGISLREIAAALGAAYTTTRAWRLDPGSSSYRRPPEDWRERLLAFSVARATALGDLADRLKDGQTRG